MHDSWATNAELKLLEGELHLLNLDSVLLPVLAFCPLHIAGAGCCSGTPEQRQASLGGTSGRVKFSRGLAVAQFQSMLRVQSWGCGARVMVEFQPARMRMAAQEMRQTWEPHINKLHSCSRGVWLPGRASWLCYPLGNLTEWFNNYGGTAVCFCTKT
jgi:hypothetical protein